MAELSNHSLSNHAGLLPPYASDLERRVARLGYSAEIDAATGRLATVTDPFACPVGELPFLAWEESVDYWRDEWPEIVKRQVIDAAELVHLHKGTRRAVEAALSALQITADITEWWEKDPLGQPGTFAVVAYAAAALFDGAPVLDARLQQDALEWVNRAKPLTRHFTFQIGARWDAGVGVALVQSGAALTHRSASTAVPMTAACAGFVPVLQPIALAAPVMEAAHAGLGSELAAIGAFRPLALCHVAMEARTP